jgi:hypothetical protein
MSDPKISELTVSQLQSLIRETVQEAVAEVMLEFHLAAEMEAQMTYEAELTDLLRHSLQKPPILDRLGTPRADD